MGDYFETVQQMNAKNTADDADLEYFFVNTNEDLKNSMAVFLSNQGKSKLLEVETDSVKNAEIFKNFKAGF